MPLKAATVTTTPTPRSTASPVGLLAQGIKSRSVQTLLKIRIEAPISTISSQIIFSFYRWGSLTPPLGLSKGILVRVVSFEGRFADPHF